jgi:hypothetical protein
MTAELSDLPLILRARKYRDMAADARHNAQAAWFVQRWSYMREAKRCEELAAETLRQLRTELARSKTLTEGY